MKKVVIKIRRGFGCTRHAETDGERIDFIYNRSGWTAKAADGKPIATRWQLQSARAAAEAVLTKRKAVK